jgi:hypothetical protein
MRKIKDLVSLVQRYIHFDSNGRYNSELILSLEELKIMIEYLDPKNGYFTWAMRYSREIFVEEYNKRLIKNREDKLNDLEI